MKRLRVFLANIARRTVNFPPASPPLGILSLAAYARRRFDLEFLLVDQRAENCEPAEVVRRAVSFGAGVVGLSAMTPSAFMLSEIARGIRKGLPNALILLGGPHVSASHAQAMEGVEADAAVPGEGERAFEMILEARGSGSGFDAIPGLIWRHRDGEIIVNPGEIPQVDDLDSLPFLAYDLVDMRRYARLRAMTMVPQRPYIALYTSRGCPYKCMYCHQVFGKRFRSQSAERIVAELEQQTRACGVEEVEFLDDIFNHDARRVVRFAELVREKDLRVKITFPNALRCDRLTEETVDALVAAGTYYSACALETGSPRLQKFIGKGLDIPKFLRGVEMLTSRGVFAHGFTMLGFPTETEEELRRTIDVACESALHTATFFTVTPYPHTDLYRHVEKNQPEKLKRIDYANADYTGIAVNLSAVPDNVLFAYQRKAWRRFYLNPVRVARIVRHYPDPLFLPRFLPMLALRLGKGLFGSLAR